MEENDDHVRTALMFEPRGHHDMFGAFICEPVNKEADFGVMFMDTGGYLNMCGHCTIGAVTVILEAGLKEMVEGENDVVIEAPAGLVRTKAFVKDGKVESVTLTNVPAFVYKENQSVTIDGKEIKFTISFGGSFFALVNTDQLDIGEINADLFNNNYGRFVGVFAATNKADYHNALDYYMAEVKAVNDALNNAKIKAGV